MKELEFESPVDTPVPPSEPHFGDELTLLSARPVVPLEKIEAKVKHRRRWFLGGAFAIAMMLGAASALVASYLKLRNVPTATAEASEDVDRPAPVAVMPEAQAETPVVQNVDNVQAAEEPAPSVVTPKRESALKHRSVVVKRNPPLAESPDARHPTEAESLNQIREAVLYDNWQERRARRVARRERRRNEHYNHRDLSNLDEIFEGRRRP